MVGRIVRADSGLTHGNTAHGSANPDMDSYLFWSVGDESKRLEKVRWEISEACGEGGSNNHHLRLMVARIMVSQSFEWTLGIMVLAQLGLAAAETDFNARGEYLPSWCVGLHCGFIFVYCLEIALRIFVWRQKYFQNNGNLFDLTVVAVDMAAIVAESTFGDYVPSVAVLRSLRMLKLVRTARVLKRFRELYVIAYSLAGVLKSIFWQSVVLFLVLTIASIAAVEIIHPINLELAAEGMYDGCDRCPRAFESVMQANLTFFQSMVAQDNWGIVIIPIIERSPATAIFFVVLTLLVVVGLMNLILSAIVDKASEVRHLFEAAALLETRAVFEDAKLKLVSVCEELDPDKNGYFSKDELQRAIQHPIFTEALQVMDLGPDDLDAIFGLMDTDGSGSISYKEMADSLQRMKAQDDHMLLILIQRTLKATYKKLSTQIDLQGNVIEALAAQRAMLSEIGQFEEDVADTLDKWLSSKSEACEASGETRRRVRVRTWRDGEDGLQTSFSEKTQSPYVSPYVSPTASIAHERGKHAGHIAMPPLPASIPEHWCDSACAAAGPRGPGVQKQTPSPVENGHSTLLENGYSHRWVAEDPSSCGAVKQTTSLGEAVQAIVLEHGYACKRNAEDPHGFGQPKPALHPAEIIQASRGVTADPHGAASHNAKSPELHRVGRPSGHRQQAADRQDDQAGANSGVRLLMTVDL